MIARVRWGRIGNLLPAFVCVACGACAKAPATNVLLLSIDSLRVDHVHANGYGRLTTPALDRLAREGTSWTGAVSPAPWTTPSMMSVMTGLPPDLHHVEEDDRMIAPAVGMLAERFRSAGYATAAFVPEATLSARFGFSRGFDLYDERHFGHRTVTSPAQTSALLHWLENTPGPFFGWVHLWDPHYNYNPLPPFDTQFLSARPPSAAPYDLLELKSRRTSLLPQEIEYLISQYDGEIALTDHYLGQILEALAGAGRLDDTLIVVFGDHGEAFQEHGWLTHTNTVYDETVRVPLIARLPGRLAAGRRVGTPCSLTGLAGSVSLWAGLSPAVTAEVSLPMAEPAPVPHSDDPPGLGSSLVVSTTRRQAAVLSARAGPWSLILDYEACRLELYDLESDPGQTHDLASTRPEILAAMRARLKEWISAGRREHPVPLVKLQEEDPELFQRLGALGYVDLFGDRLGRRSEADPLRCP